MAGCAVPQKPGKGKMQRLIEPTTSRGYWLYLPEGYSDDASRSASQRAWPLVVTFHGMKPWDSANPQCREWQEEADRYGFVICAPELATCNSMMEYPIREVRSYVQSDEIATMAIMDDIFLKTNADPNRVLSTSWSAGGYIAHYMVNRHPERFSCVAVRQSNFSPTIMDSRKTVEYSDMTVAIFYTENDFQACRQESEAAVEWYRRCGFQNVQSGVFQGMGHERTPEAAASVFAKTCGSTAKSAPTRLARLEMMNSDQMRSLPRAAETAPSLPGPSSPVISPRDRSVELRSGPAGGTSVSDHPTSLVFSGSDRGSTRTSAPPPPSGQTKVTTIHKAPQPTQVAVPPGSSTSPSQSPTKVTTIRGKAQPPGTTGGGRSPTLAKGGESTLPTHHVQTLPPTLTKPRQTPRRTPPVKSSPSSAKGKVRLSSTIGISPLLVSFTADVDAEQREGADFFWTDNGIPICSERNGQKILMEPGRHRIEVLVITKDNQEIRAGSDVTVFERLTKPSKS
jgi:hypothetical protein